MIEALILHPALLVAKGFESLNTADMRFLHAYRKHFEGAIELHRTCVYRPEDFLLGGILNPQSDYFDIREAYAEASHRIDSFPYMTMYEIRMHFYYGRILKIFDAMLFELYQGLSIYANQYHRPISFFQTNAGSMRYLEGSPMYHQVVALHQCGLGRKLVNAFEYVFDGYVRYVESNQVGVRG